jgi:CRP/FNR family cyclic AMP-dependent transcriptional regulator
MRTITDLIAEHPFFKGLDQGVVTLATGCARNVHFSADEYLFREAAPADHFYLVRSGRVALEFSAPGRQPMVLDTASPGDVVGWSWLVPPYRWFCDGRAVEPTSAVALDGACLRDKCDSDPATGYLLLGRVAHVMYERMQSTRLRLLDLYGVPGALTR